MKFGGSVIGYPHLGRFKTLLDQAATCMGLSGPAVEVGVYRGGSLIQLAKIFHDKVVYGIDTFEGIPYAEPWEFHKCGDFSDTNFEGLKAYCVEVGATNVKLIQGIFPEEQVLEQIEHNEFCFVHIDVDVYKSVKDCISFFVPKLVPGGILIVDDYAFRTTEGAKKAVNEYVKKLNRQSFGFGITETGSYRIKKLK